MRWGNCLGRLCSVGGLDIEVFGLGVVGDDGVGGLFGDEHEVLSECDGDGLRLQKLNDEFAVFEVWAGGVAEGVAGPAVGLLEELAWRGGVFAGKAEFGADAFMPELGECFGGFDGEAVEVEVILVFVIEA